jgi:hypothetical protein
LEAQKKLWIERTPMKRLGAVEELNHLAVFLASDASTYMTGRSMPKALTSVSIPFNYPTWNLNCRDLLRMRHITGEELSPDDIRKDAQSKFHDIISAKQTPADIGT